MTQRPTKVPLSLPSSAGQGRECNGRLMGRDKGIGRSLTCNLCRQNRFDLGKNSFNLLLIKNQSRIMANKYVPPPHPSCSQFLTPCLCCSFLLRGWTPHTLPAWGLSQIVQCDSFPRAEVLHELLHPVPYSNNNTAQSVVWQDPDFYQYIYVQQKILFSKYMESSVSKGI